MSTTDRVEWIVNRNNGRARMNDTMGEFAFLSAQMNGAHRSRRSGRYCYPGAGQGFDRFDVNR